MAAAKLLKETDPLDRYSSGSVMIAPLMVGESAGWLTGIVVVTGSQGCEIVDELGSFAFEHPTPLPRWSRVFYRRQGDRFEARAEL